DESIVQDIIRVSTEKAKETCRDLARKEGILAGISSGAATYAAIQIAEEMGKGKTVVVLLPDTGERYLSTDLFGE
ncbi:MAG: pyridoxal-phosphate dependent enzyme, partial [Thermoplasmata archaeon]|nr:pyridoxal-phosphate dependent enzyme [Thermoplasmata archaeon]